MKLIKLEIQINLNDNKTSVLSLKGKQYIHTVISKGKCGEQRQSKGRLIFSALATTYMHKFARA